MWFILNFFFMKTTYSFRLAHPKIVRACGLALKDFEKNSPLTNHCIVKLLHRIAWDCKMYVMVFQASIFRTFLEIYSFKDLPQFKVRTKKIVVGCERGFGCRSLHPVHSNKIALRMNPLSFAGVG